MKILKIFGIVVAFHAAVFMFIFAIPGCRSTGKQKPATAVDAGATSPLASTGGDVAPAGSPVAPAEAPATVRFSPTRPGTPAAAVLEAQPVAEVQPVSSYSVAKNDSLWTIAKKHGVTVKDLAAANNLKPDVTLRLGQKLIIPGKNSAAPTSAAAASTLTYTVKAGDSLDSIARHAGTTKAAIKSLNKLKSETVRVGQTLTLPAGGAAASAPAPEAVAQPARGGSMTHVIKAGETLGSIARKYQVKTGDLAAANNIADPTKIRVGQELKIPGWQAPAAPKAATPAPAAPAAPAFTPAPAPSPVAPAPESPLFSSPSTEATSPLVAPETPVIKVEDGDTKAN